MGSFAAKRRGATQSAAWAGLSEAQRAALPPRFEAVGEAQAVGEISLEACREAGRHLANDGVSLEETLGALSDTCRIMRGDGPRYVELVAVATAWSESMLGFLHRISCEDPTTGLATRPHLRAGLADLYRVLRQDVRRAHALVVVETCPAPDHFSQTLRLGRLGRSARTVFAGSEIVAGVGTRRVLVVVRRDPTMASRVALLRRMLEREQARVWIEGLPGTEYAAMGLLDELARC